MKHHSVLRLLPLALCILLLLIPSAGALEQPLTQAETELTAEGDLPAACAESSLGNLAADAARSVCGADLALLPAAVLQGSLESGAVFESDLERVIPEDLPLLCGSVTPAQLKSLLENGVSRLVTDEAERIDVARSAWEGFPQVSGFSWEYDVSAPAGERVLCIWVDGQELDLDDDAAVYTLVSTADVLDGTLGYAPLSARETGDTLRGALAAYCVRQDSLAAPPSRSTTIGTANYPIFKKIPIPAIAGVCVIVALIASIPRLKQEKYYSFRSDSGNSNKRA